MSIIIDLLDNYGKEMITQTIINNQQNTIISTNNTSIDSTEYHNVIAPLIKKEDLNDLGLCVNTKDVINTKNITFFNIFKKNDRF